MGSDITGSTNRKSFKGTVKWNTVYHEGVNNKNYDSCNSEESDTLRESPVPGV